MSKEITRFKLEAKMLKKANNWSHHEGLDAIAKREGFPTWSVLMKNSKKQEKNKCHVSNQGMVSFTVLRNAVLEFVARLNDAAIYSLCSGNGSLWVDIDDVISGDLDANSFQDLGHARDGATVEYADRINAILLIDLDGFAYGFVFEDENDDDDDDDDDEDDFPRVALGQEIYSTQSGRQALLDCIDNAIPSEYDSLSVRIDDLLMDREIST